MMFVVGVRPRAVRHDWPRWLFVVPSGPVRRYRAIDASWNRIWNAYEHGHVGLDRISSPGTGERFMPIREQHSSCTFEPTMDTRGYSQARYTQLNAQSPALWVFNIVGRHSSVHGTRDGVRIESAIYGPDTPRVGSLWGAVPRATARTWEAAWR